MFNQPPDTVILFTAVLRVFKHASVYLTASDGTKAACLWNLSTKSYVAVEQRVLKLMDSPDKMGDKLHWQSGNVLTGHRLPCS